MATTQVNHPTSPLRQHLNQAHLKLINTLFKKGYASQVLLCSNVPPAIRIPALLTCRLYEQMAAQVLNEESSTPLYSLWLVIASHATGMDYEEAYAGLENKYKEIADDWIQMNKPLSHPQEVKKLLRTKFQQLLLKGQEDNYYNIPQVPVFLVSCKWLENFYDDNLEYIPAVDNSDLVIPMRFIETEPRYFHTNYKLKEETRENVDFKIIPYEAWMFLKNSFGGIEFRRLTTNQKEPVCEVWLRTLRIVVVENRHIVNGVDQTIQIQVSRFDTISAIIERIQKLLINYGLIKFQSLKSTSNKWAAVRVSNLEDYGQLVDLIQDEDIELWNYTQKQQKEKRLILERLEYKHDFEQSELSGQTDLLLIAIASKKPSLKVSSFLDIHSVPIKQIISPHRNQCLTCEKTEDLQECACKTVYFCCKECKSKNSAHEKVCRDLMKEDSKLANLFEFYAVKKRQYDFDKLKKYGKVGLENLGNTCYLNSALQCVLTLETLNQFFVSNSHLSDINTINVLGTNGNLACAYGEFIKDYYTTNRRALEPTKILKIIAKNPQFRGYNHQDSQEFLNYFLDKLHEDLNRVRTKPYVEDLESDGRPDEIISRISWENYQKRNKSFISENLAGQYRSQIRCPDCKRISITFDPFMSVTLPFPKAEKNVQVSGYFLTREGQFKKVTQVVPAAMASRVFLKKFFHEPVHCHWLRNKIPTKEWNVDKSVYYNIEDKGVLMFYPRPEETTIDIHLKFQGYDIFHRRLFFETLNSEQELINSIYLLMKTPLLKATKNDEILGITNEEYLKLCHSQNFIEIVSLKGLLAYPVQPGILEIKVTIKTEALQEFKLKDKIKFDYSSGSYSPSEDIKVRSIHDDLKVSELLESFSEPEQLTEDNAWYCSKCKEHKLAEKTMSIYKTPKNLILHLKRFNHRGNRYVIYGEKVKTPVVLSPTETINGEVYELVGVVNHFGSLSFGHYTATVKREEQWMECDDSSVRRREADGSNAYLLFYRKKQQ